MILVDDRAGSKELATPLEKLGLDVELTRLAFGDLAWEGKGEKGRAVSVGVEFKQLEEFVSSVVSQRIQGHQMIGMRDSYDYSYLLVEGELLFDRHGSLQKHKRFGLAPLHGNMTISTLLKRKHVLHLCGGLNPIFTTSRKNTLQELLALYRVWTDKALDQHKSHLAIYEPPPLLEVSDFRRVVSKFPGVGLRTSLAVERQFKANLRLAVCASVEEWAEIEVKDDKGKTRRLGLKAAERIVAFCRGQG